MDSKDLIKTVRGLDQNGPGENGEKLQQLWNCLSANSQHHFHAAEESSLRWLLKSMNGTSEAAETLRRYPLTWTILECAFLRIPLFSLAKSLADRKFLSVLQQTLKDAAKSSDKPDSAAASKRKKTPAVNFSLEDLRGSNGCLSTMQVVLRTLKSLLSRLEDTEGTFSRDRIGAEHIRSLFCLSATDSAAIIAPILTACENLLKSDAHDQVEGSEEWIGTSSTIWDLHLQAADDAMNVAMYLFRPAAVILSKLDAFQSAEQTTVSDSLKYRWSSDLQSFMIRNFAVPSRAAFVNAQDLQIFNTSLEITRASVQVSAPALYFIASKAAASVTDGGLRKDNAEWIKSTFRLVEAAIRGRSDQNSLMSTLLDEAVKQSVPVDVDDLRQVCRSYALGDSMTDWSLIAKITTCDADVFQVSDAAIELRTQVCDRSIKPHDSDASHDSVLTIIQAMRDGFRTRRKLPSFLRFWFEQMCKVEKNGSHDNSPWFLIKHQGCDEETLSAIIEKEMSPQQLKEVITWVQENQSQTSLQSVSVLASTIAEAIRSEPYIDAAGWQLFDLVSGLPTAESFAALNWRVVSKSMSWGAQEERRKIWNSVKKRLSKIMRKSPILSGDTYEAFKCCYQAWDAMAPDDTLAEGPAELVEEFTQRLATEISSCRVLDGTTLSSAIQRGCMAELDHDSSYQQYLTWVLKGSSRFTHLYYNWKGMVPTLLTSALSSEKCSTDGLEAIWNAILRNECNLNETKLSIGLVDRVVAALEESAKEKNWPGECGQLWIKVLNSLPLDSSNRAQREKLMTILAKRMSAMAKHPNKVSLVGWRLVFGLVTKTMSRPTFHESMAFIDLVEVAEGLSQFSIDSGDNCEIALELIQRFSNMASATIRQMAEHNDERSVKYFREAFGFVSQVGGTKSSKKKDESSSTPFSMTLLKVLVLELDQSQGVQSNPDLASLLPKARQVLATAIMTVFSASSSDKELFESHETAADVNLLAATDAAAAAEGLESACTIKTSTLQKFEKRARKAMQSGDVMGWKIEAFLRRHLAKQVEVARLKDFDSLRNLPSALRVPLLQDVVGSMTGDMDVGEKLLYVKELVDELRRGCDTDGQLLAIDHIATQIIQSSDFQAQVDGYSLAVLHSELTSILSNKSANTTLICRILRLLLEKRPQAMGQWNIEVTLSTVSDLASADNTHDVTTPYTWLCKLVEVVIKKHRLRLEGHYHLLLTCMQSLLRNLVISQQSSKSSASRDLTQEANAHAYCRLITLICEPTAGAVSRGQLHSALDSATDAAKRSAGRHMYLILVQYVKLQLEANVSTEVREALEPAMNSIFDITSPEGRKILNDTMDSSGRAILREMFKRYVKFGKWSGV